MKITFEKHEITIVHLPESRPAIRFCSNCRANVRHLPIARAAFVLKISETAAFRLVETKKIHSTETETGALLICQKSLSKGVQYE